jgi:hypothetical protein
LDAKGQAAIEVIFIAVMLLGMLLSTSYLMVQRNNEASGIAAMQRDMLECRSIASAITGFASNQAYSQAAISIAEKEVRIEKGSIMIGLASCDYRADAWLGDEKSAQGEGFALLRGRSYTLKKDLDRVVFIAQ